MESSAAASPTGDRYNAFARLLHWLIAGMIVLQYVLARMAEGAEEDGSKFRELVLLANHKSVGLSVLALVLVRLAWRLFRAPPAPLPMPVWQRRASVVSHWSFYALLLIIPMSGWLMSSASNISVSWFNLFQLPDFVAPDERLEALFEGTHETLTKVLFVLALIHVSAALKHTFVDRDGILRRISSPIGLIAFFIVIIAGVMLLTPASRAQENGPVLWDIDYEKSAIRFTAEQAGAEFEGEWKEWSAELRFDPDALDSSSFNVAVSVAGVDTLDRERDETLLDPEFFDGATFPLVHYRANEFSDGAEDGVFIADGAIEVKGSATPAKLTFTIERDEGRVILEGSARLDRLALNVGTGEWEDTAWIGQHVDVEVRVEAAVR